jgi:coenzyme F420 biosynthesis associated uncharacterized protein
MTDPIAWDLAERVAVRVAGREPLASSYHFASLQPDFEVLTAQAEELVAAETGLRSLAGPARARVTDRAGWIAANIASFRRLFRPWIERLRPTLGGRPGHPSDPVAPVARTIAGAQLGVLLGWMSTRVLGQYDLLLIEDESPEDQDIVCYVGPNILALEKRFAFPPAEFRLWLALHETTHRAQFTGIPWMRQHYLSLVEAGLSPDNLDLRRLSEGLRRAAAEVRAGRNPLDEGGLIAILASDDQLAVIQKVQGLMSLLEGHGDITMDRAGADRIPSAARFQRVLRQRRVQHGPARILAQAIGLEAKLKQYEQGERFIEAVEAAGGPDLLARAWAGPDLLPSLSEIRDPASWIERVQLATAPSQ